MAEMCRSKNYVADIRMELLSEATFGTLRNIFRAATYSQYRATALVEWRELAA